MKIKTNSKEIDISSFFKKGIKKINDNFGVLLITGYQGSGKTYFAVKLVYENFTNYKIFTNIHSFKIPGININYFTNLDEITENYESNCLFLIDEISKKYTKDAKQDKAFYSWLQQSRKSKRIVILITQEYLQCPIWIRGVARSVYTTNKMRFLPFFKTYRGTAYLTDDKEWSVDPDFVYIYKRTKIISSLYDTLEPVPTL